MTAGLLLSKSRLIAINDADPTQIKVVTENGTVYLMGIIQPEQADIAVCGDQQTVYSVL